MDKAKLQQIIDEAWEGRDGLGPETTGAVRDAVKEALARLDSGALRVAEKQDGQWRVNEWLKKAVLLSFLLNDAELIEGGPGGSAWPGASWYDKVPLKFAGWNKDDFDRAGFRVVPGAIVRHSAYIAPGVVLMPCFVNVGARIGEGTMIDTWSTVGSCAQIGRNVHISGGVGIGGVLEPLQAAPVIIEDGCFIGARSEVAEGVIVEEGAVISMGVFISASTPIIDRASGEITRGRVPAYAVVVPGTLPGKPLASGGPGGSPGPGLAAAVIVKRVDAGTRAKTSINEILRG
ncbi:MAG: 2,3,4,5-tetrahydropyridine-2,6-dicarboxylate N-succinyltransferase [Proteobacteria bacterium]|nr:2,3,4,5-tetrahydropyridine-2,6-dicarboxylate N-succinyltransferase [Pseudomonadota bacterium]